MHLVLQVLSTARILEKEAIRIFKPHGLSVAQFNVLHLISDQRAGMRASDIARALIVDPSNVTGLLKRMKQDGLLVELSNSGDRRQHVAGWTPKGKAAWEGASRDYQKKLRQLDAALSAASRKTAGRALQDIERAVSSLS